MSDRMIIGLGLIGIALVAFLWRECVLALRAARSIELRHEADD